MKSSVRVIYSLKEPIKTLHGSELGQPVLNTIELKIPSAEYNSKGTTHACFYHGCELLFFSKERTLAFTAVINTEATLYSVQCYIVHEEK